MRNKILILGITEFLGRNLAKIINDNYENQYEIIGTGNTNTKINKLKELYNITIYNVNILNNFNKIEDIIKTHNISYIINTIALKHVTIAEDHPSKAVELNLVYTLNLLNLAKKYDIINLINISSNKANNPINVYGMTKYLMEKMTFEYNYSIYQGVNFFWSDNSVLDIWYNRIKQNKNIYVNDNNQERYFIEIEDVCNDILNNLDCKGVKITSNDIFKVKIIDLFSAIIEFYKYDKKKCEYIKSNINEKTVDELGNNIKIDYLSLENIIEKIKNYSFT